MYKIKGEIKVIGDVQQVSDSFKKLEFVVTDSSSQYAQDIQLQLVQDRCDVINNFKVGDSVEVTFFLRGREWVNPKDNSVRYFNSLDAWKIDSVGSGNTQQAETFVADDSDNLPF